MSWIEISQDFSCLSFHFTCTLIINLQFIAVSCYLLLLSNMPIPSPLLYTHSKERQELWCLVSLSSQENEKSHSFAVVQTFFGAFCSWVFCSEYLESSIFHFGQGYVTGKIWSHVDDVWKSLYCYKLSHKSHGSTDCLHLNNSFERHSQRRKTFCDNRSLRNTIKYLYETKEHKNFLKNQQIVIWIRFSVSSLMYQISRVLLILIILET